MMNGGGDRIALVFHMILWWSILILLVDTRGTRGGKCCHKYFSKENEDQNKQDNKGISRRQLQ